MNRLTAPPPARPATKGHDTMASNLALHNPKFAAKLATFDQLRGLPEPQALGPMHKPVAHYRLIEAFRAEILKRGMAIARETFALAAKGHALFGVIDLATTVADATRCLSLGFRNSVDMSLGIQAVAGASVFVCDNLALAGSMFALKRKNTTGLDLGDAVAGGFDKFLTQGQALEVEFARLQATGITDERAKQLIYEAFADKIVPVRLFDDVDAYYFRPGDDMIDCQPRTLWGLHNAFTRSMRDLSPVRRFAATVDLGKHFGLGDVIDVEGVVE